MLRDPAIQVSPQLSPGQAPDRGGLRRLRRRLRRAGARLAIDPDLWGTLAVRIVGEGEIEDLHQRFMGLAGVTDVLSFPADEGEGLGDLALCWPVVMRQAARAGPGGWIDEATVLLVHGLVHLLGHDHRGAREGRRMHRRELQALRAVHVADVPRPYVRHGGRA